jgi:hypothetical protein
MADASTSNKDGTPQITLLPGSNVNYATGGLANPHNYWIPFIQDHYEDNDAKELALRGDAEYSFGEGGWLNSLKVGVRYADRKQNVRYSTYNWSPMAAPWNCNGPGFNVDNTTAALSPYPGNCRLRPHRHLQGLWRGHLDLDRPGRLLQRQGLPERRRWSSSARTRWPDRDGLIKALSGKTTNSPMQWTPLCERTTNTDGCFIPPEMLKVRRRPRRPMRCCGSAATTRRSSTASPSRAMSASATSTPSWTSSGGVAFPVNIWYATIAAIPCGTPLSGNNVVNISCWLKPDLLAFSERRLALNAYKRVARQLAAQLQRPLRADRQAVRPLRRLARPVAAGLRPAAQLRRRQSPAINTGPDSPYIVYNADRGAHRGQRHRL